MTPLTPANLEDGSLIGHIRKRIAKPHKRGRKPSAKEGQLLSRTAEKLLRRIAKVTADGDGDWAEENDAVAKALHVDRSTVVRTVRRFREVGVLSPVDTKGGRGHVSVYRLDFPLAKEALHCGRWPEAHENRGAEGAQQGAYEEKEPQGMPPFAERIITETRT